MKLDTKFKKGQVPWNKNTKGVMKPNSGSFKKGDNIIPLGKRFIEKVEMGYGDKGCWQWLGSLNNKGYGRINVNGVVLLAHRVSYEMDKGKIPKGMNILHRCDNPQCVNPNHLTTGTQKDNNEDMWKKQRGVKGEKASWSKLKQIEVDEIRNIYVKGGISMRKIAKQYNVSFFAIYSVINNNTWK